MTSKVLIRCINKLNNYKVHLEEAKNDQPFEKVSDICFIVQGAGYRIKASSYSSVRRNTYLCNCSAITSTDAVGNGVAYLIVPLQAIPFPRAASSSCPGV